MIDQYMHKLTVSQALVLCMSELPFAAGIHLNRSEDIIQQDHLARHEFSRLPMVIQVRAVLWLRGQIGEGCNWDNRRKA